MIKRTRQILYSNILYTAFIILSLRVQNLWQRWRKGNMFMANEIRQGMMEGQFSVHYQPVFEAATGACCGAEALLRWYRADGSCIPPSVFIPEAEKEGVIVSLTQHLFGIIADDLSKWQIETPFHLSVNIAGAHLQDKAFTKDIQAFRDALKVPVRLVLEITEHTLVQDTILASLRLNALRRKGCYVAIDDFGTGYSSLGLLQSLPVDYLKIDKMFIDSLTSDKAHTPVLETIINLSKRLGLKTIAEGVSADHQAKWLIDKKVSFVQGYYYSRPKVAFDFYQWYCGQNIK
ncbi:TPA: EAL domain-containing protein [Enterobacter asburiae]|uniref:EAL domain-containing protein n=1 Tax=Enterobacter asburiae TaxID=61645 RepID=UPI001F36C098|nr:EAL domain-containing protein [Enterobacter asburiae]MCF1338947.1 EAL domain-containing protein [Enterobacter asburiae]MCQ4337328.1 EAL domain-containing protein [Enterobacter asburiae]HDC4532257.1 EAL domain-containing protein [Enterobacter asburiae]HDC4561962.1 EAL domain-containing protein [Enterobacter asburiae]